MASASAQHFDHIIQQFQTAFGQVEILSRDEKPSRARLEITGVHGPYQVRLVEILTADAEHKYAYYVLRGNRVVAGFDNAPDPLALQLKYGADYTLHRLEQIPHYHTKDKASLALTEEMDCTRFISWIQANLPLTPIP